MSFKDKNILVTGANGMIGRALVKLLEKESPKNITTADLPEYDLRSRTDCSFLCHGQDYVFHLAGIADIVPSIENPSAYFKANVEGTLNMLELAHKTGVKRFIYAASSSSYGVPNIYPTAETAPINPQYPYALTKHMGEELVMHWEKVYKLPAVSLRLFNVYGPRSRTAGTYGAVFGVFLAQKKHIGRIPSLGCVQKCIWFYIPDI